MLALKPLLQTHGVSQAELSRAVSLSPATIAQLLNKHIWPSEPTKENLITSITTALNQRGLLVQPSAFEPISAVDAAEMEKQPQPISEEVITMLLRKQSLTPAAKRQFNLFRDPFTDDVNDSEDVFSSPNIRTVREYMYSTSRHGGFLAIIGESGAGKSTLRRDLIDRIARETAPIVIIEPYVLGMEDNDIKGKTLKSAAIADAIIRTVAPNEKPLMSMEAKSRQLHRVLKDSKRAGYNHCLIIEEAHALNTQTLKHLKRFLELEDGFKKLLSIILIGQTELKIKLSERAPEVREVVQRCELIELNPLDANLEDYLAFKFKRVGAELDTLFEKGAIDAIRERLIFTKPTKTNRETISLMYPLMIHNLVTAAANQAAGLGFTKITKDLILEA